MKAAKIWGGRRLGRTPANASDLEEDPPLVAKARTAASRSNPELSLSSRKKLSSEVTSYLREAILTGEYTEGQRLRVEELAERFDLSTMPIREALASLAGESLVTLVPRRGYRVIGVHQLDLPGVFEVHAFTAGLLAERAGPVITDADLESLREIQLQTEKVAKQRISSRQRAMMIEDLNFQFHRTINHVPDAAGLRWFLRAASRYVPRSFYQVLGEEFEDSTVNEHPRIIEALSRHDGAAARALMEEHIRRAGRAVTQQLLAGERRTD
jgi:DNA-binding GntR family transcriptional regulator